MPDRSRGGFAAAAAEFDRAMSAGKGPQGRAQAVYRLDAAGTLERVAVRTGISDGKFTEIVEGDLRPGDKIVVGQATARVQTNARPPGGGRMF
jgi:HlyD family secretion protein